jgi:hypothetical protein
MPDATKQVEPAKQAVDRVLPEASTMMTADDYVHIDDGTSDTET